MSMTEVELRNESIKLMMGFMEDVLYKDQAITKEDLADTATIYYDVVVAMQKEVKNIEEREIAAANAAAADALEIKEKGLVDASNATQVDIMGGPRAIDESTLYKG